MAGCRCGERTTASEGEIIEYMVERQGNKAAKLQILFQLRHIFALFLLPTPELPLLSDTAFFYTLIDGCLSVSSSITASRGLNSLMFLGCWQF
ncbi:hypothetical protein K1719_022163 [Acacia pycnantha]|nr:hypothetical protein K1719_022163 [Acacia pycnantha]